uniref:Mucin-17-like n=1 Tax=Saccoglossus kowalevskii TaxID=10224 RepID=A0ABM0MWB8_SACKO
MIHSQTSTHAPNTAETGPTIQQRTDQTEGIHLNTAQESSTSEHITGTHQAVILSSWSNKPFMTATTMADDNNNNAATMTSVSINTVDSSRYHITKRPTTTSREMNQSDLTTITANDISTVSPTHLIRTSAQASNTGKTESTIQHITDQTEGMPLTTAAENKPSKSTIGTDQTVSSSLQSNGPIMTATSTIHYNKNSVMPSSPSTQPEDSSPYYSTGNPPKSVDKSESSSMPATDIPTVSPMIHSQTSTRAPNTGETGPTIQQRTDQTEGIHLTTAQESRTSEHITGTHQAVILSSQSSKPFMTATTMADDNNNNAATMTSASINTVDSSSYYKTKRPTAISREMNQSDLTTITANDISTVSFTHLTRTSAQASNTGKTATTIQHITDQTEGMPLTTAAENKPSKSIIGTDQTVSSSLQSNGPIMTATSTIHYNKNSVMPSSPSTQPEDSSSYYSTGNPTKSVDKSESSSMPATDIPTVSPMIHSQTSTRAPNTGETGPTIQQRTDQTEGIHLTTAQESRTSKHITGTHQAVILSSQSNKPFMTATTMADDNNNNAATMTSASINTVDSTSYYKTKRPTAISREMNQSDLTTITANDISTVSPTYLTRTSAQAANTGKTASTIQHITDQTEGMQLTTAAENKPSKSTIGTDQTVSSSLQSNGPIMTATSTIHYNNNSVMPSSPSTQPEDSSPYYSTGNPTKFVDKSESSSMSATDIPTVSPMIHSQTSTRAPNTGVTGPTIQHRTDQTEGIHLNTAQESRTSEHITGTHQAVILSSWSNKPFMTATTMADDNNNNAATMTSVSINTVDSSRYHITKRPTATSREMNQSDLTTITANDISTVSPTHLTRTSAQASNTGKTASTIQHITDQTEGMPLTTAAENKPSKSTIGTDQTVSSSLQSNGPIMTATSTIHYNKNSVMPSSPSTQPEDSSPYYSTGNPTKSVDKSESSSMPATDIPTVSPMIHSQTSTRAPNTGETGPTIQQRTDQTEGIHLTTAQESRTSEHITGTHQAVILSSQSNKPFMTATTMADDNNNNAATMTSASINTVDSTSYYKTKRPTAISREMNQSDLSTITANDISTVSPTHLTRTSTQASNTGKTASTIQHITDQTEGMQLTTAAENKPSKSTIGTDQTVSSSLQSNGPIMTATSTIHYNTNSVMPSSPSTQPEDSSPYYSTGNPTKFVDKSESSSMPATDIPTVSPMIHSQTSTRVPNTGVTGPTIQHRTDQTEGIHLTTAQESRTSEHITGTHQAVILSSQSNKPFMTATTMADDNNNNAATMTSASINTVDSTSYYKTKRPTAISREMNQSDLTTITANDISTVSPTHLTRTSTQASNTGKTASTIQHITDQTEGMQLTTAAENKPSKSTIGTDQTVSSSLQSNGPIMTATSTIHYNTNSVMPSSPSTQPEDSSPYYSTGNPTKFVDKSESSSMPATDIPTVSPMIHSQTSTRALNTGVTGPTIQHRTDQTEGIHLTTAQESRTSEHITGTHQAVILSSQSNKPFMTATTMADDNNNNAATMTSASINTVDSTSYYKTKRPTAISREMNQSDLTTITANDISTVSPTHLTRTSTQASNTGKTASTIQHITDQTEGMQLTTAAENKPSKSTIGTDQTVSSSLQSNGPIMTATSTIHYNTNSVMPSSPSTQPEDSSPYYSTGNPTKSVDKSESSSMPATDIPTVSPMIHSQTSTRAPNTGETGPTIQQRTDQTEGIHLTTAQESRTSQHITGTHQAVILSSQSNKPFMTATTMADDNNNNAATMTSASINTVDSSSYYKTKRPTAISREINQSDLTTITANDISTVSPTHLTRTSEQASNTCKTASTIQHITDQTE